MPYSVKKFGWLPDLPDQRDFTYSAPLAMLRKLPAKVDLSGQCPPVYDQGELGSCTGNSIAAAIEFAERKQRLAKPTTPSRLFIYYNERVIEHTVATDSGAMIRDGIKSVNKVGACRETTWPYKIGSFAKKPSSGAYAEGRKHTVSSYQRVARTTSQMRGCLASGFPFVFGFTVYTSFMSAAVAKTGKLSMPHAGEKVEGGHAVLAVGYDDAQHRFIVRNSWGPDWGMKGYFTMPYAYLLDDNLSDDFWTIRVVE
ncbi:MAG TPA: C1 family peptidase [Candidatus Binatia bacterium]|nr:C1 family peptidase [Candidatus Binatia bacterium]